MARLDFDKIVQDLTAAGIPNAYVEQTGGGCATIFFGLLVASHLYDDDPPIPAYAAGPGVFDGPGWTQGVGDTEFFTWGHQDEEKAPMHYTGEPGVSFGIHHPEVTDDATALAALLAFAEQNPVEAVA